MSDIDHMRIEWIDRQREPQCAPNPDFPDGIDVDCSAGAAKTCAVALPYPAKRLGLYMIECQSCGGHYLVTTAGRRDDPRSLKVACVR